jgi:hypothetical protein
MDMSLFDRRLQAILADIVMAVDRSYDSIGVHFKFKPIRDY